MNNFVFLFVIAVCGTCTSSLNVESVNRIVGGTVATDANQFRYMISLQDKSQLTTPYRGHRCGGALVTTRHAVTAAACLYDNANGVYSLVDASNYRVFAGALELTNDDSADRYRDVERFTVHPEYHQGTPYVNDIAVIAFTSEFSTSIVQVASLAVSDPIMTEQNDYMCTSSGWGSQDHTNTPSTQLMQVSKVPIFDHSICQSFFDLYSVAVTLKNTMLCAASVSPSSSSCQGDLGNPLVCGSSFHGILIRPASSNCSEPGLLNTEIYTRISSYREWIQTTAGASTFQPGMAVLAVIAVVQIITTL